MTAGNSAGYSFADSALIAETAARMLIEIGAVAFNTGQPYRLISGLASPVYVNCGKILSYPRLRRSIVEFSASTILREVGFEALDSIVGGDSGGIPFAAWLADALMLPMQYVRPRPKGFGRNAQIEGHLPAGERVLLVEDVTSDARSKINFSQALRGAGAKIDHVFVVFYYGIFPETERVMKELGLSLHRLTTWADVLAAARAQRSVDAGTLAEVEKYLADPLRWSASHGGAAELPAAV